MRPPFQNIARMGTALLLVLLVIGVSAFPGRRVRRGYNSGGYSDSSGGGYGRGSDERDASVSEEGGGNCGTGYVTRGYTGSRELAYNRDGRPSSETRGGRSFTKASASAAASATAYGLNKRSNIV